MNTVIETIKTRRSVRSYNSKEIPREVLNAIIEAGNEAPSAMNSQPWRFVVVQDVTAKRKLLGAAMPNAKKLTFVRRLQFIILLAVLSYFLYPLLFQFF